MARGRRGRRWRLLLGRWIRRHASDPPGLGSTCTRHTWGNLPRHVHPNSFHYARLLPLAAKPILGVNQCLPFGGAPLTWVLSELRHFNGHQVSQSLARGMGLKYVVQLRVLGGGGSFPWRRGRLSLRWSILMAPLETGTGTGWVEADLSRLRFVVFRHWLRGRSSGP